MAPDNAHAAIVMPVRFFLRRGATVQNTRVGNYFNAPPNAIGRQTAACYSAVMERANLKISAIIPLLNSARFITQALDSVFAQTIAPTEVIVVDGRACDEGPAIVARYAAKVPLVVLPAPQGGANATLNFAINQSSGALIALLNPNDIWYPEHLASLSRPFLDETTKKLGWSCSDVDEIDEDGHLVKRCVQAGMGTGGAKLALDRCLSEGMAILQSTCMLHRAAVEAAGGFDETLSDSQMDDLLLRLFLQGYRNVHLEQALSQWRNFADGDAASPRVARDHMHYARKLLARFPDDPDRSRFYASRMIAPRFLKTAVAATRMAMRSGDEDAISGCMDNIAFLERQQAGHGRMPVVTRDPLISAIVPLYNGGAFIQQALLSVLNQTLPPDEIIVIDDGSTDVGPDIVAELALSHPILLIRKANGGQSSARNVGVDHAHGDLIAFLDQDDVWYQDHLAELVKPFLEDRALRLGWSYSDLDEINEAGEMIARSILARSKMINPKRDLVDCLRQDLFILPSACLIAREAFQRVGGFDERLSGYEDDDLFLRLFLAGFDNVYLPAALSQWRIYRVSSSYSPRMAVSRAIYARMLIERFPDDLELDRYYRSDLIAPRFFSLMLREFRKAMLAGTKEQQVIARGNLEYITGHLRATRRMPVRVVLLPALRVPMLAHFIMRYRFILLSVLRRIWRRH